MKGLYQILAEDYRDYQLKEPIRAKSKSLIESTRPSKLNKNPLKEACKGESCNKKEEEIIKGSEKEDDKKSIVKEEDDAEVKVEDITEEPEEVSEEVEEVEEKEPTALEKVNELADISKEELEAEITELSDEDKEAIKAKFEAIKNVAMELFPEEVEEDIEEITEEIPEEPIEEEPFEECEITSFKVTRIAPKVGAVMIEAQTKDGLKYITGKNFNESEKTLDEAEISTDKTAAANRFKGFLK